MVNVSSLELEVKVPPKKFWDAIRDSPNLLPKVLPSIFKSVEVIEGDGHSVGSVRYIKYDEGMKGASFAKEKLVAVDQESMWVTWTVVEGEVLGFYKTFKPTLKVLPGGDSASCLVKWSVEYETVSNEVPPPDALKETAVKTFKAIEGYLHATA